MSLEDKLVMQNDEILSVLKRIDNNIAFIAANIKNHPNFKALSNSKTNGVELEIKL